LVNGDACEIRLHLCAGAANPWLQGRVHWPKAATAKIGEFIDSSLPLLAYPYQAPLPAPHRQWQRLEAFF